MALDLHDLEAYLCLPKLLASFAVSVSARVTKQSDFENMILEWAAKRRVETIVAHLNNLMRTAFGERGISISGTYNDDLSKIHKAFVLERNSTIKTLDQRFSDANIKRYIDEMDKKINDAISMRDINAILVLFKGKQLFEELKPHVSLQDTNQAVRLIAEKTLVNEIPELGKLRIALRKLLGLAE